MLWPGVCPSVETVQCSIRTAELNTGSLKQHQTMACGIEFSETRDLCQISMSHA